MIGCVHIERKSSTHARIIVNSTHIYDMKQDNEDSDGKVGSTNSLYYVCG